MLSAEHTSREKENVKSLVSDISHQTKTPMTNIRLHTSLLTEALEKESNLAQPELYKGLLEALDSQTEKLQFLITSLTKLSRLESNVLEVVPICQNISLLLRESLEEIEPKAKQKQITVRSTYLGNENVCYDLKWTKEALENVLDNAVKYYNTMGEIVVSVKVYEIYVAISVKDKGIGIKEEDLPKIFGRFYRSEDVQQQDGVGIGLYLAREILKREHGYIKVQSKPGEGSEFMLYLPKHQA